MAKKDEAPAPLPILTFEQILAAEDVAEQVIAVPEWGGSVRVRNFTKDVEMRMRAEARGEDGVVDNERLEMLILIYGVVEPVLTPEAIPHLRTKSSAAIDRILSVIVGMNRMKEGAVQETVKEFQGETGTEGPVPPSA